MNNAAAANVGMPRFSNTGSLNASPNAGRMTASFGGRNASALASASNSSSGVVATTAGFLSGWGGILLILVALVILFAVYYQTIGYYIQLGWEKLKWSHDRGEKIEIDVPGPISAHLSPAPAPAGSGAGGASISASLSGAINRLESDVEAALGSVGVGPDSKQVFNISRNLYTFAEAEPVCRAFGAELATYDQVKAAYENGADWCNYGWVKGQLAIYPTQKDTYEKLQHGPEDQRMSCGLPGVNGGYFPNAEQRFGVNCYGPRPVESALDERTQIESQNTTEFDREVNHFRAIRDSIAVSPWNGQQWSS